MRRTPAATRAALPATLIAVLITGLGAGCATSGTPETRQADANAPAAITWWSTGGDDESAAFQKAADLYTKSHPNVTIKVQTLSWDDAYAKLLAASTSRSGPDVISGGMTWTIQFGLRGGMVDLRKYGAEQLKAQAQPAQWKSAVSPDGTVYGIPLDMSTEALYYRTDLLEKAGIKEPPTSWDELTADIGKLKDAGVKTPFSIDWGNLDWIGYFNFLYQAGGSFYTPDCKPSLGTPEAERALSFWIDLHRKYGAPTDTVTTSDALDAGTAMVYGGTWNALGIDTSKPKLKGKWAVAPLPAGPAGPTTFIGGRAVGVTSYSKHIQQAADFVKYLYTDEAVDAVNAESKARNVAYIPPRPDKVAGSPFQPQHSQVFAKIISTGAAAPGCPGWDESAGDVAKHLQSAILGKADMKTALGEAAKVMERNAG
ncbi:extracellular solute-binding protein [Microbispora cellulosiformans]|uniref:Extracellular solute-binding protein n=1 Tax=Microbispora cellulosiformans TaxID=2614688 RepID=A0A5J5K147_9ACTN|nr:extracellular solute-binding protein [Microbispora cellulosiformans]KAA9377448.1 extracellular solute-binding protein [Microbispora cellulosiformans]